MPWTWFRPADPTLLEGRPLLDLGTGDGQTLSALVSAEGLVVGADRSLDVLRTRPPASVVRLTCADAERLPFAHRSFVAVLAADLLHHLDAAALHRVLDEARRVLKPGGVFAAWWYESAGRPVPDAPRYPRPFDAVAAAAVGFARVEPLSLTAVLEPAPPTAGLVAYV